MKIFALLASDERHCTEEFSALLKTQQIQFWNVQACEDMAGVLDRTHPELIITAAKLHDGTWRDIVSLVRKAPVLTNVLVLAESEDARPYLPAVIDYGVFDFIPRSYGVDAKARMVRAAARDYRRRRRVRAFQALAGPVETGSCLRDHSRNEMTNQRGLWP